MFFFNFDKIRKGSMISQSMSEGRAKPRAPPPPKGRGGPPAPRVPV